MILSCASENRPGALPVPVPVPVPSEPRTGPSPWLVTFNTAKVLSDLEELSLPDLARENEDWDRKDEDHPDPGKIKYWEILCTILINYKQF